VIEPSRRSRQTRRRPRALTKVVAAFAIGLILFAIGIAVGQALNDNPTPGLTVTTTKTIIP
jgi:hypothetical protein